MEKNHSVKGVDRGSSPGDALSLRDSPCLWLVLATHRRAGAGDFEPLGAGLWIDQSHLTKSFGSTAGF